MSSIPIEEYKYKGFNIQINFASGEDWDRNWKNKFFMGTPLPFRVAPSPLIEELKGEIKKEIDNWLTQQPSTNEEWVRLVSQCVIQDGYEDWHVDEKLIMNVLNRYAKFKNKNHE